MDSDDRFSYADIYEDENNSPTPSSIPRTYLTQSNHSQFRKNRNPAPSFVNPRRSLRHSHLHNPNQTNNNPYQRTRPFNPNYSIPIQLAQSLPPPYSLNTYDLNSSISLPSNSSKTYSNSEISYTSPEKLLSEYRNIIKDKKSSVIAYSTTTPSNAIPTNDHSSDDEEYNNLDPQTPNRITSPRQVRIKSDIFNQKNSYKSPSNFRENNSPENKNDRSPNRINSMKFGKLEIIETSRSFDGVNELEFAILAHYLVLWVSPLCLCLGIFSILWTLSHTYHCKIDNEYISYLYFNKLNQDNCPSQYLNGSICCHSNSTSTLNGSKVSGIVYIIWSIVAILFENTSYGFGLWHPSDSIWYNNRLSPIGLCHLAIGIYGLFNNATLLGGGCLILTSVMFSIAAYRDEAGDLRKFTSQYDNITSIINSLSKYINFSNPFISISRIYKENKMWLLLWLLAYFGSNIALFIVYYNKSYAMINDIKYSLLHGQLDISCTSHECEINRQFVKYGPLSVFIPWATASGYCLYLNCGLLQLTYLKMISQKLYNFVESHQPQNIITFVFVRLVRWLPLKYITSIFYDICMYVIILFSSMHIICHFANLIISNQSSLEYYRFGRWGITQYLIGGLIVFFMIIVIAARSWLLRHRAYYLYYYIQYVNIIVMILLCIHGTDYVYWAAPSVLLYFYEVYCRFNQRLQPYQILKVEYIQPVLIIYFQPLYFRDLQFIEGQSLSINFPSFSLYKWFQFPITSSYVDFIKGPRVICKTGEEVAQVPKPLAYANSKVQWNPFYPVSKDYARIDPIDYIDKSDTAFMDFISCHILVDPLNVNCIGQKLKSHFEKLTDSNQYPLYFSSMDDHNEVHIGRYYDNKQKNIPIIRVDNFLHSSPIEHYFEYDSLIICCENDHIIYFISILISIMRYYIEKNLSIKIVKFHWILDYKNIHLYHYYIHLLTDLSYDLKQSIVSNFSMEMHLYVVNVDVDTDEFQFIGEKKIYSKLRVDGNNSVRPLFTANDLLDLLLSVTEESRGQMKKMKNKDSLQLTNHFDNLWVWNGMPYWSSVFKEMKLQSFIHKKTGVLASASPSILAELRNMCARHSFKKDEDFEFTLHSLDSF